jgi:phage terminase large subunit-like protein
MAIRYDGWQSGAVRLILGRDAQDRYAATIGGVTMSLPRQVGKTFTIGSLLVAMCIEYPGLRVVWTSHHLRTTTNTFRSMQGMVRRKRISSHLARNGIRTANGEQEIRFANGSIIMFGAREHGFGVGIDAIDVMVCDEAQRLTSRALADMVPTTNQARHVHGALVIFIGTPPRPGDAGDEFTARRKKALAGKMQNGVYIEMSADPDAKLDDPEQWAKANPSYPHRTPHESMLRMRENLTDDGDWRREAMGIWGDTDRTTILPGWPSLTADHPGSSLTAIGLAVSLSGEWGSIAQVDRYGDMVNLDEHGRWEAGPWMIAEAVRIYQDTGCVVAIDEKCPDATLAPTLRDHGVPIVEMKLADYVEVSSEIENRVKERTATHQGARELNDAVANAKWRDVGGDGRKVPGRKKSTGDIDMLEAALAALWASRRPEPRTPMGTYA